MWLLVTVLYALNWQESPWNLFIWALPATALVLGVSNYILFSSKIFRIISSSFLIWLVLLSLYIELLTRSNDNVWAIFIIGIPLQTIIVLIENIKFTRKERENE